MLNPIDGLTRNLIKTIKIQAPVEACYGAWIDSPRLVSAMRKVLGVCLQTEHTSVVTSAEEIHEKVKRLNQENIPATQIKHWLFSGPGGKLYEIENTVILDIPNRFYCTTSTDPDDLCVQSSLLFIPDELNKNTTMEWRVFFWDFKPRGKLTQFVSDIWEKNDSFMDDCLEDFKKLVEQHQ
jgi:uncharacterized membrane protein